MTDPKQVVPTEYATDLEKKLKKCFDRISNGKIGQAFESAIRLLVDESSPDRYSLAAHSIRRITFLLTREISREVLEDSGDLKDTGQREEVLKDIRSLFQKALEMFPCDDDITKKSFQDQARQRLEQLLKDIATGKINMRQKLKSLFGKKDDFEKMTRQAREAVKIVLNIWSKCHDYFNGVSKDDVEVDERKFRQNWLKIQDCWWSACCIFIEATPEIDEAIAQGPLKL